MSADVDVPKIRWFQSRDQFMRELECARKEMHEAEARLTHRKTVPGFCSHCVRAIEFKVSGGPMLGEHPNLREGLLCSGCGLNNRCRLVLHALNSFELKNRHIKCVLLEATTRMARHMKKRYPTTVTSEYFGPERAPGAHVYRWGRRIRHESLLNLSYPKASIDLFVHLDILEHIYDYESAMVEVARVLLENGRTVFTAPFFPYLDVSVLRGRPNTDGTIEHFYPPEYHGDSLGRRKAYTFHHFGWDFVDRIRSATGLKIHVGIVNDAHYGFTGNNHRYERTYWMPATVFAAGRELNLA